MSDEKNETLAEALRFRVRGDISRVDFAHLLNRAAAAAERLEAKVDNANVSASKWILAFREAYDEMDKRIVALEDKFKIPPAPTTPAPPEAEDEDACACDGMDACQDGHGLIFYKRDEHECPLCLHKKSEAKDEERCVKHVPAAGAGAYAICNMPRDHWRHAKIGGHTFVPQEKGNKQRIGAPCAICYRLTPS